MFNSASFDTNLVKTRSITLPVTNGEDYLHSLGEGGRATVTKPSAYSTVEPELSSNTKVNIVRTA